MHPINKLKNKNHMTTSIYTEKAFDKIQHSHMKKTLQKVETEGVYLNTIKAYMTNPQLLSFSKVKRKLKAF